MLPSGLDSNNGGGPPPSGVISVHDNDESDANDDAGNGDANADDGDADDIDNNSNDNHTNDGNTDEGEDTNKDNKTIMAFFRRIVQNKKNINLETYNIVAVVTVNAHSATGTNSNFVGQYQNHIWEAPCKSEYLINAKYGPINWSPFSPVRRACATYKEAHIMQQYICGVTEADSRVSFDVNCQQLFDIKNIFSIKTWDR